MAARYTEKQFWDWFSRHAPKLKDSAGASFERLTDELLCVLQRYCEGLAFEIGHDGSGCYEFVVTAYGNTDYFEAVERLVAQAPRLDDWRVTAFKPPMPENFRVDMDGVAIDTAEAFFIPLECASAPNDIGVRLFLQGYDPALEEVYMQASSTVLQTILGEKSFAYDLQHIEMEPLPGDMEGLIPILDIPDYIQWKEEQRILN